MKTSDSMTLFFRAAKQLGNLTPRDIWRILRVIEIAWNQLPSHPSIFDAESLDCHLEILKRALMLIPARPNQPKAKTWWPVREKNTFLYSLLLHQARLLKSAGRTGQKEKKHFLNMKPENDRKKNTCNGKKHMRHFFQTNHHHHHHHHHHHFWRSISRWFSGSLKLKLPIKSRELFIEAWTCWTGSKSSPTWIVFGMEGAFLKNDGSSSVTFFEYLSCLTPSNAGSWHTG